MLPGRHASSSLSAERGQGATGRSPQKRPGSGGAWRLPDLAPLQQEGDVVLEVSGEEQYGASVALSQVGGPYIGNMGLSLLAAARQRPFATMSASTCSLTSCCWVWPACHDESNTTLFKY